MTESIRTLQPEWDRDNRRFRPPERCPYPDCAQPVPPLHWLPALGWCAACERPYEAVRYLPTADEAAAISQRESPAPMEVYRRPWSAFSTTTGSPLRGDSLLDWNEAGGSSGRSHSPRDPLGNIFGLPAANRRFRLRASWDSSLLATDAAAASPDWDALSWTGDDRVVALTVVRGQVVAVTARGWIGIFEAAQGAPRLQHPLEWPDASTDPLDPTRWVRHPPVLRGSRMLLSATHQAQFRDLGPFLFFSGISTEHRPRLVDAAAGRQFIGPPLGIDLPARDEQDEQVLFALLQGRPDPRRKVFADAEVLLFDPAGRQLGHCPAPDIVRPPVFDPAFGLLWVDVRGAVRRLSLEQLEAVRWRPAAPDGAAAAADSLALEAALDLPDPLVEVEPSALPTLQAVPNPEDRPELWLSREQEGRVEMLRVALDDLRGGSWHWERRVLGKDLGNLVGFAVGYGSRHRQNAGGHLLAVATDRQVGIFPRFSSAAASVPPLRGPEQQLQGSREAPLVCSAGVLARFQDGLRLGSQSLGWNPEATVASVRIAGSYDDAQGLAMLGRQVFVGAGMSVRCYQLVAEEVA